MKLLSYSFKYKTFFFLLHRHCTKIPDQFKVTTSLLVLILTLQRTNNHVVKCFVGKRGLHCRSMSTFCLCPGFFCISRLPSLNTVIVRGKHISDFGLYTKPPQLGECAWCGCRAPDISVAFLASRLDCPYCKEDIPAVLMNVLERPVHYCSRNTI